MADWLLALIAAFAGLIGGAVLARIVRSTMSRPSRPDLVQKAAAPAASFAFSVMLVAGLVTALGFVNDDALDRIPNDLVDFLPNMLSALIVVIVGNLVATLGSAAVEGALSRAGGRSREQIPRLVRIVVLVFAIILAAAQLGVDTTILNISVAAVLFTIGTGTALMIGLGSRDVASEIAAGRALRHMLNEGDEVKVGTAAGTVVALRSVAVELRVGDASTVLVPNSEFLRHHVNIHRAAPADD